MPPPPNQRRGRKKAPRANKSSRRPVCQDETARGATPWVITSIQPHEPRHLREKMARDMEHLDDADDPDLHAAHRGDVHAKPEAISARAPTELGLKRGQQGHAHADTRRAIRMLLTSAHGVHPTSSTRNRTHDVIGHYAECRATSYARAFRLNAHTCSSCSHPLPPLDKENEGCERVVLSSSFRNPRGYPWIPLRLNWK